MSKDRPLGRSGEGNDRVAGLPGTPSELRHELLRRLDLAEREVRALSSADLDSEFTRSIEALETMERELRRLLRGDLEDSVWTSRRDEIITLWKEHRRLFERLAAEREHRFSARPGRRNLGPRW